MKNTFITVGTVLGVLLPQAALGYISPEEVLLNRELYLPPTAREAQMRTDIQNQESAARREAEQEANRAAQQPEVEEDPEEEVFINDPELHGSAPELEDDTELSDEDRELLSTMRLLTRIQDKQDEDKLRQQILYLTGQNLHSGAPLDQPLAPTGAGTVAALITLLGAGIWTLWKVRHGAKAVTNL